MDRLGRGAAATIVIAILLAYALFQLIGSISYSVAEVLVDWWEGEESYSPDVTVAGATFEYFGLVTSATTLLLVLAVVTPFVRARRRREAVDP